MNRFESTCAKKSRVCVIEQSLLKSRAFHALRRPASYRVLAIFWTKRQIGKVGRKGKREHVILNNGEITFTFREAKKKYGISESAFRDAIDELREKGFLDIVDSGAGLYRSANLYALSERWKLYGTPEYEPPKSRPKKPINKGFQKGNRYGRNCKKKISTVISQHSSTVIEQHSSDKAYNGYVEVGT